MHARTARCVNDGFDLLYTCLPAAYGRCHHVHSLIRHFRPSKPYICLLYTFECCPLQLQLPVDADHCCVHSQTNSMLLHMRSTNNTLPKKQLPVEVEGGCRTGHAWRETQPAMQQTACHLKYSMTTSTHPATVQQTGQQLDTNPYTPLLHNLQCQHTYALQQCAAQSCPGALTAVN